MQRVELPEIKLRNLEPGSQGHIIARVTRLWDTILPGQSIALSKELLFADDQVSASILIGTFQALPFKYFTQFPFFTARSHSGYNSQRSTCSYAEQIQGRWCV